MHSIARILLPMALLLCGAACGLANKSGKQENEGGLNVEESAQLEVVEFVAELTQGTTCEVLADFGVVEPRSIATRSIRIVNNTDSPIVLLDYDTTCRCTTIEFDRKPIDVGGKATALLKFDSRGEWGNVGNFLDITTSNPECGFVIWMAATVE